MNIDSLIKDIEPFSDLDSDLNHEIDSESIILMFRQHGDDVRLRVGPKDGRITEQRQEKTVRYGSLRGLLMSQHFGNINRLVESSLAFLKREAPYVFATSAHLPIVGSIAVEGLNTQFKGSLLENADRWLQMPSNGAPIRTLVIDGPAGIGKTHLIRRLVLERALGFGQGSAPPILHVQSKGKKLTTLNDVIAGTLNALRLTITNEQVPVLVRNGLLHLAIDGFDELADPAGYETAWGSVVDLVEDLEGSGALILAGRDTFIDVKSVKSAVVRLDNPETASLHLRPLTQSEAEEWLENRLSEENVKKIRDAELLSNGSYALRPLFINEIAKTGSNRVDFEKLLQFPLKVLTESIVNREALILAGQLRNIEDKDVYELLDNFFIETARFMADAESESIELASIDLLAEVVFSGKVRDDEVSMMRHRASAFALFEQDGATSRRKFPHTEIQDYFLAKSYLETIAKGEISKSVRRNILGSDFLQTFHDVASDASQKDLTAWRDSVTKIMRRERYPDRAMQNLGAMTLAIIDAIGRAGEQFQLENLSIDEVCIRGTAISSCLSFVNISHLDVRGADISALAFSACEIGTILANDATKISDTTPRNIRLLLDIEQKAVAVFSQREIDAWMNSRTPTRDADVDSENIKLLERICRVIVRQHWIRDIQDDRAGRLLHEPGWEEIRTALLARNLLRVRDGVAAGGPKSDFIRIESATLFLNPDTEDADVLWVRDRLR